MEDQFLQYLENKIKCEEDLITTYKASIPYIKGEENIKQIEETILILEISNETYKEVLEIYKREKTKFKIDWSRVRSDMGL